MERRNDPTNFNEDLEGGGGGGGGGVILVKPEWGGGGWANIWSGFFALRVWGAYVWRGLFSQFYGTFL